MFPVSIDGRYEVGPLNPAQAELVVDDLGRRLAMLGADDVLLEGRDVSFRAGMFRVAGSWNLLLAIDKGIITVNPGTPGTVEYTLSTVRMLVLATLGVAALTASVAFGEGVDPWFAAKFLTMGWLWLFGANYLIASIRLSRFIKLAAPARKSGPVACPECGTLYDPADYRDDVEALCLSCHSPLRRSEQNA